MILDFLKPFGFITVITTDDTKVALSINSISKVTVKPLENGGNYALVTTITGGTYPLSAAEFNSLKNFCEKAVQAANSSLVKPY
jgi:hypothetical protein